MPHIDFSELQMPQPSRPWTVAELKSVGAFLLYRNPNGGFLAWVCEHSDGHTARADHEITVCEECAERMEKGHRPIYLHPSKEEIEQEVEMLLNIQTFAEKMLSKVKGEPTRVKLVR
jgi:hypothetical protein